jgi:hypothetical protein
MKIIKSIIERKSLKNTLRLKQSLGCELRSEGGHIKLWVWGNFQYNLKSILEIWETMRKKANNKNSVDAIQMYNLVADFHTIIQ